MNVHDFFARLINMPSPTMLSAALGLGSLIAVLGLLLLIGTVRWVGRIVRAVGLILIMLVLVVVREQTITERQTGDHLVDQAAILRASTIRGRPGLIRRAVDRRSPDRDRLSDVSTQKPPPRCQDTLRPV